MSFIKDNFLEANGTFTNHVETPGTYEEMSPKCTLKNLITVLTWLRLIHINFPSQQVAWMPKTLVPSALLEKRTHPSPFPSARIVLHCVRTKQSPRYNAYFRQHPPSLSKTELPKPA